MPAKTLLDLTPGLLDAAAGYFRDACDGPERADEACALAAAIVRAAADPMFVEAMMTHAWTLESVGPGLESPGMTERYRRRAEAVRAVLALVAAGGGR